MILFLIPAALLLLAMADMPSGYYVFMRIVVCLFCCIIARGSYNRDNSINAGVVLFGLMAIFMPCLTQSSPPTASIAAQRAVRTVFSS